MEKTKLKVLDNLMNAKTQDEAQAAIMLAIHALEEHKVHKHLIVRFIMKLIDQLMLKRKVCVGAHRKFILDKSILFLVQLNYK